MALEALRDVLVQSGRDYFNMTRARVDEQREREQRLADIADQRAYMEGRTRDDRTYNESQSKQQVREELVQEVLKSGAAKSRADAEALVDSGAYGDALRNAGLNNTLLAEKAKWGLQQQLAEVSDLKKTQEELAKASTAASFYQARDKEIAALAAQDPDVGANAPSFPKVAAARSTAVLDEYNVRAKADPKQANAWLLTRLNKTTGDGLEALSGKPPAFADPAEAVRALTATKNGAMDDRVSQALLTDVDKNEITLAQRVASAQLANEARGVNSVTRTRLAGLLSQQAQAGEMLLKLGYDPTKPAAEQPMVQAFNARRARLPAEYQAEVPELNTSGFFSSPENAPPAATATATATATGTNAVTGLGGVSLVKPGSPVPEPAPVEEKPVYFAPGGGPDSAPVVPMAATPTLASGGQSYWGSVAAPLAAAGSAYALSPAGQDLVTSAGKAVYRGAGAGMQALAKTPELVSKAASAASDSALKGYIQANSAVDRALTSSKDYFTKFESSTNNRFGVGGIEEAMRSRAASIAEARAPARAAAAEAGAATRAAAHATRAEAAAAKAGMRFAHPNPAPLVEAAAEKRAASYAAKIAAEKAATRAATLGTLRVAGAAAIPVANAALTGYTIGEIADTAGGAALNAAMGDDSYRTDGIGATFGDYFSLPSSGEQQTYNTVDSLMSKRSAILRANIPPEEKQKLAAPLTAQINSILQSSSYFSPNR